MITTFNGREVEYEIEYASTPEDSFVTSGCYIDTLEELTDGELELLQDAVAGEIEEAWYENQQGSAERFYEGDR